MMGAVKMKVKESIGITPCPRCRNTTDFTVRSAQVCEDGCEVWAVCKCGYDPTAERCGYRQESVWGEIDRFTARTALDCWNDAIQAAGAPA